VTQLRAKAAAAAVAGGASAAAAALQASWMIAIDVDVQHEGRHRPSGPLGRLTAIAAAWYVRLSGSCRQDQIYCVAASIRTNGALKRPCSGAAQHSQHTTNLPPICCACAQLSTFNAHSGK